MRYLDTNVLIRIITGDLPEKANQAINAIQAAGQNDYCILDAVLVEACFVLEFYNYKMARSNIADAMLALIDTPQIYVSDVTLDTIKLYKNHPNLDYVDCLLFITGGKKNVMTFDVELQKELLE
jgi:predicted nucleic-acid-binding protein